MMEAEALDRAWAVVRENDLEREILGFKSIRLFPASEVCDDSKVLEALGLSEPADIWHVKFVRKPEKEVVCQYPNEILITIEDRTGEPTLHRPWTEPVEPHPPGVCPECSTPVTDEPTWTGMWSGGKVGGSIAGGGVLRAVCAKCGSTLKAYEDVYDNQGEVMANYELDLMKLCWSVDKDRRTNYCRA